MAKNTFQIRLKVNNIGPHYGDRVLDFADNVESNKAIFYALNGTGKTFISRAFRLAETIGQPFDAARLLSLGATNGNLDFSISTNQGIQSLVVGIEQHKQPAITDTLQLKFHVFNSDFIEENVRAKSFTPDGNIGGYILGKIQIDLSEERTEEGKLTGEIDAVSTKIDEKISNAKKNLQAQGVQANTSEMRLLTRSRIEIPEAQEVTDTFEQIVAKLNMLANVPENLTDVYVPTFSMDTAVLEDVVTLLTTEYPQSSWDEEFVSAFQKKRAFLEVGLGLETKDEVCPFCGQRYDTNALEMIRSYRTYLADKQAQTQKRIEAAKNNLESSIQTIETCIAKTKSAAGELSNIAHYFSSLNQDQLQLPEVMDSFKNLVSELTGFLDRKSDNLALVIEEKPEWKRIWETQAKAVSAVVKANETIIKRVNKTKNNANGERLSLRRDLCKVRYSICCEECKDDFALLSERKAKLKELQGSIKYKEQQTKISKKEKVFNTLTYLLNQFFFEKYTIDADTFEIRFLGRNLGKSAGNILSDGEKGIVAFCLYLAYVHQLVESEDDYEKLFFIIDDPISSMDFNYVYAVAQTLREIKKLFAIQGHERVWVFTHNLEFLSIIARNHVLPNVYLMTPGNICHYDYKLLMPYESHLHDIVMIAEGRMEPSHTTGNSIRHVIETISKFEDPQIGLDKYMQSNETLSSNSVIFSLCQDLSHGNMRSELPYTPTLMRSACQTVKAFVESKYPEQISNVKG